MISVLLSSTCFCLKLIVYYPHLPRFLLHHLLKKPRRILLPAERERVRKLIHRLHVSGGHASKTSLRLLLHRRGCPVWMQHTVDQLQCDSCLESSDAQNAQRVSLATPPKLWQAVKVDIFELEDSQRKVFFALYMDAACKLSSCSCFLEGNPRQRFEPNGATLSFHIWPRIGCSIFHSFSFLISDPGGCVVSNELREWAGIRGIGLLTAPGEFHGLTADLENLIRDIKRLARKLVGMELCGHRQATAHAHVRPHCVWLNFEHTKNSNRSKKIFATKKIEFESAN